MSNNAPDYENDLVFEPEMTWEQLVEFALKRGWTYLDDVCIYKYKFGIGKNGSLFSVDENARKGEAITPPIFKPEQMKAFVENMPMK